MNRQEKLLATEMYKDFLIIMIKKVRCQWINDKV